MKHRRWKTSWVLLAVALFVLGLLLWGVFEAHWELWRPLEMGQTVTLHGDGLSIYCIKFSPDDTQLAAAGSDGTIRIWDTGNWHLRTSLVGHVRSVYTVCFTPDGNSLVSGGNDGTVRLWDLQSGRKSIILRTFKREVAVVCFSPDGKYLAAAATDLADTEEITVWDLATKQEWSKQQELSYSSKAVAFSPDGRSLAIGGSTGHPKIWHFKDGTETMLPAGNDSIDGIAYAPTGTILAGVDGGVMVWDLVAEQEFVRLKKPRFHFHCVSLCTFTVLPPKLV